MSTENKLNDYSVELQTASPEQLRARVTYFEAQLEKTGEAREALEAGLERIRLAVPESGIARRPQDVVGDVSAILRQVRADSLARHPDDAAVDRFARTMKLKLAAAREKGRDGWDDPDRCSVELLADLLIEHLHKANRGNYVDIANLAMMLHLRMASPELLSSEIARLLAEKQADALYRQARELEERAEQYRKANPEKRGVVIGIGAAAECVKLNADVAQQQAQELRP